MVKSHSRFNVSPLLKFGLRKRVIVLKFLRHPSYSQITLPLLANPILLISTIVNRINEINNTNMVKRKKRLVIKRIQVIIDINVSFFISDMQLGNYNIFYVFMGQMQEMKNFYSSLQTWKINGSFSIFFGVGMIHVAYN